MVYPVPVHARVPSLWPQLSPPAREAEAVTIPLDLVLDDISGDRFSALSDSRGEERRPFWSPRGEGLVINGIRDDVARYEASLSFRLESYRLTESQLGQNVDIYV